MDLFWVMTWGSVVIWLIVIGLAVYATRLRPRRHARDSVRFYVLGGGLVLPVVVLTALFIYGFGTFDEEALAKDAPRIVVTGEQWWWRVRYENVGRPHVELANEIRLPRDEAVRVELESSDVIHSLWLPALAGKRDLVPGRRNVLVIRADQDGSFRGTCAEFCGLSHAKMGLTAEVMPPAEFRRWVEAQAAPAATPGSAEARRGAELFLSVGCGNCHAVRGTGAHGRVGPDLTHVASRPTIAAGTLPNTHAQRKAWIADSRAIKPGARMPAYPLPESDLDALSAYLGGLR
jgi:cytochrome c oxidase subunit 2